MFWTPKEASIEARGLADEQDLRIGRLNSHQIVPPTLAMAGGDAIAG